MEELKRLLRRDWFYFLMAGVVFIMAIFVGYYLQVYNPGWVKKFILPNLDKLKQIAELVKGQPVWVEIGVIWLNNVVACLLVIIMGFFLPVLPLWPLLINGFTIGVMHRLIQTEASLKIHHFYLGLLPHGIFELPAYFIAVVVGVRFGIVTYQLIWQRFRSLQRRPLLRIFFTEAREYIALIPIMLLVAAIIEVTVSPLLIR